MKTYNYIYIITNIVNGKIYIGKHSTDDLNDGYLGSGKKLRLAKNKYGNENFKKEILAYADTEKTLNWLEKYYIRKYKSQNPEIGYNLTAGGDGHLGYHPTEYTLKLYSLKRKGVKKSEQHKKKIGEGNRGEKNGMYGTHKTDTEKQHLKTILKDIYDNTPEIKEKISKKLKTKWNDPVYRSKIIGSHRVYDNPEHTKWHMSK